MPVAGQATWSFLGEHRQEVQVLTMIADITLARGTVRKMTLRGNLRDFSTAQLLNLISLARKTGTLSIDGRQPAQMAFREGKLVYASLGPNGRSLARVLHESGLLTAEQGQIIETRAHGTGEKQLGHMLIRAGFVTQSDIIQSIRQHILAIAFRIFSWADGAFQFEANQLPPTDHITVPVDLDSVIMEGSRRAVEWERLQEEIPDLDVTLRFSSQSGARLERINLTPEEWRVVSLVGPRHTLRYIADSAHLNEFDVRRVAYGLAQVGLVEVIQPYRGPSLNGDVIGTDHEPDGPQKPTVKKTVITRLINRIRRL
ncbi:MAG: DUF4388 domain-containing protein [Candidatus Promineifilaceae bacterium]